MAQVRVFSCECPACRTAVIVPEAELGRPLAPRCRCRTAEAVPSPFGRREWDACRDPRLLRECLAAVGLSPTPRKARLAACGVGRTGLDWCRNFWFREALAAGECWADSGQPAANRDDLSARLRSHAAPRHWVRVDWAVVGLACVADPPDLGFAGFDRGVRFDGYEASTRNAIADVYRDVFGNPFLSVDWKADWRTAAVLGLARTIYDAHAFDLMPILADALADAGCDHQVLQDHSRGPGPHARGCWVLDGLLRLG